MRATTGDVPIIADPTPYGSPRANCPRPARQHALDWNQQGIQGPPGQPGGTDNGAIRVYEYERAGYVALKGTEEKQVVALPVPSNAVYAVSAKVTAEAKKQLLVRCFLSMVPSAEKYDDVAVASTTVFSTEQLLDYPTQTLYLQEVYRIPESANLRILRVRCKSAHIDPSVELTNISIQAIRLPYAPN